jgi:hypothetical protein
MRRDIGCSLSAAISSGRPGGLHQFDACACADTERDSRAANGYASPHHDFSAHRHAHTADQHIYSDRVGHANTAHRDADATDGDATTGEPHGVCRGL